MHIFIILGLLFGMWILILAGDKGQNTLSPCDLD